MDKGGGSSRNNEAKKSRDQDEKVSGAGTESEFNNQDWTKRNFSNPSAVRESQKNKADENTKKSSGNKDINKSHQTVKASETPSISNKNIPGTESQNGDADWMTKKFSNSQDDKITSKIETGLSPSKPQEKKDGKKQQEKIEEEKKLPQKLSDSQDKIEHTSRSENQKINIAAKNSASKQDNKVEESPKPKNSSANSKKNEPGKNENSGYLLTKKTSNQDAEDKQNIPILDKPNEVAGINIKEAQNLDALNQKNKEVLNKLRLKNHAKIVVKKLKFLKTLKAIFHLILNSIKNLNLITNLFNLISRQQRRRNLMVFKALCIWKLKRTSLVLPFLSIRRFFKVEVVNNQDRWNVSNVKSIIHWRRLKKKIRLLNDFSVAISNKVWRIIASKYNSQIKSMFISDFLALKEIKKIQFSELKRKFRLKVLANKYYNKSNTSFIVTIIRQTMSIRKNKLVWKVLVNRLYFYPQKNRLRWLKLAKKLENKLLTFLKAFHEFVTLCQCKQNFEESSKKLEQQRENYGPLAEPNYKLLKYREYLMAKRKLRDSFAQFNRIKQDVSVIINSTETLINQITNFISSIERNNQLEVMANKNKSKDLETKIKEKNNEISKLNSKLHSATYEINLFDSQNAGLNQEKCDILSSTNKLESEIAEKSKLKNEVEIEIRTLANQIELKKKSFVEFVEKRNKEELVEAEKLKFKAFKEENRKKYLADLRTMDEERKVIVPRSVPSSIVVNGFRGNIGTDTVIVNGLMREIGLLGAENDRLDYELNSLRENNNVFSRARVDKVEEASKTEVYLTVVCGILFAVFIRLYIFKS